MESILARALEYTLKYWLKSFSRDQFKLQGHTVQLSNLDMDGDALHSSLGLPPAINVTTARVGKLEIVLPSVSNVQVEPIVMQIDRLDLVLEENSDPEASLNPNGPPQSTSSSSKGSGYGFADKIADGMTVEVGTVNLLLETRGGARKGEGASWTPPMASITVRGLTLYTTNEDWQVVNLKEARESSSNKNFIYVFKKLEWDSLSVDLLPHPDMFMDTRASASKYEANRDDDGAKRAFFGGERFLEGISGEAYITLKRTTLNDPLGLEVRLHINEAVCPALSEPGLRALLRFLTGIYVCLNREDVDPKSQQRSTEAAGCSLISISVEHLFFCIKDMEFRLELLMQSLFFSRASVCSGDDSRNLTEISVGGLFLRDTFSRPPCTLIQPAIQSVTEDKPQIPDFAENFCPPIYPLDGQQFEARKGVPFISLHTLQMKPTPSPPLFASQTAICCQPLIIHLQEESCLRISSFLADGIPVGSGAISPEYSINSLNLNIKELDMIVPLDAGKLLDLASNSNTALHRSFGGARLNIQNLFLFESPCQKMSLLDLEKDPACFCLWQGQPIDASQKKSTCGASSLSLSLETIKDSNNFRSSSDYPLNLWKCIELKDVCIEVAMATADGRPLTCVPPPGGIVRVGVACKQHASNTSVEQLFFVLDLYEYFESVNEKIALANKTNTPTSKSTEIWSEDLMSKAPSDTAMSLSVKDLQLRFLEDSSTTVQGKSLAQFIGEDLYVKVTHRTLGGAVVISSNIRWDTVEIDCVDAEVNSGIDGSPESSSSFKDGPLITSDGYPELRAVLWVQNKSRKKSPLGCYLDVPFLELNMIHVVPLDGKDTGCHSLNISACIAGIRLGGGMNYTEALLQQFGILGLDGRPGEGLSRGMKHFSNGPLSKIFKPSPLISDTRKENGTSENGHGDDFLSQLGHPEDVDISINLKDWLFALEGAQDVTEMSLDNGYSREERCWHSTFRNLRIKAKNNHKSSLKGVVKSQGVRKYPVDFITVGVEGLQTLKPQVQMSHLLSGSMVNGSQDEIDEASGGVSLEARMVVSEDDFDFPTGNWEVEKLKFSVEQPIEAIITKDELQHLASLGKTEVESMGRIAAGILRVLKLEGTIGQEAINQLSNLGGSGSLDNFFNAANLNKGGAIFSSTGNGSPRISSQTLPSSLEAVVTSLKAEVSNSRAKCADLLVDVSTSSESSSGHIDQIKQLEQKLQNMESLLKQLRMED